MAPQPHGSGVPGAEVVPALAPCGGVGPLRLVQGALWRGQTGCGVGWDGRCRGQPGLAGRRAGEARAGRDRQSFLPGSLPKLLQWREREGSDLALMQKEVVWWGRHTLPVGRVSMGSLLQGILHGCIPQGSWMQTGFLSPGASPRAGVQAAPPTP